MSLKKLTSSVENYLETIYLLSLSKNAVRVRDISRAANVTMPSVHQALHILKEHKMIKHENYGYIELTASGRIHAKNIYSRHQILLEFLSDILKVPVKIAEKDACRIEHSISEVTLKKLVAFVGKLNKQQIV